MTKAEMELEIERLWERIEMMEEVQPWKHWAAPTIPVVLPTPRTDREFELAYRLMHPTPGGDPRCTW